MNFAVVDDDNDMALIIAEKIAAILSKMNIQYTYKVFCSPYEFYNNLQSEEFQAVFLDIDMPELSGFKLSEIIQTYRKDLHIIFISNRDDLITTSFRYIPLGFVRKNYIDIELPYAIETLNKKLNTPPKMITVRSVRTQSGENITINVNDIVYVECHNHVTDIHLLDESIISTRKSLKFYSSNPDFSDFSIISSGILANLNNVVLKNDGVKLPNGRKLFGSRRRMQKVKKSYMEQKLEVLI